MMQTVAQWDVFEASFAGPADGNPYLDVSLEALFTQNSRTVRVPGFYDGDGVFRIRFMPDRPGEWRFKTQSNIAELDGQSGGFLAVAARAGLHGPVSVANRFHFAHADGTPYFPFGTTCYAWTHQPLAMQEDTPGTLGRTRFNKIRMGVFPKDYPFNTNEPLLPVFAPKPGGGLDHDRPNPEAFRHFETQVERLRDMGIQADIIIFHPYDRWGIPA